jgi:hypothetical protein
MPLPTKDRPYLHTQDRQGRPDARAWRPAWGSAWGPVLLCRLTARHGRREQKARARYVHTPCMSRSRLHSCRFRPVRVMHDSDESTLASRRWRPRHVREVLRPVRTPGLSYAIRPTRAAAAEPRPMCAGNTARGRRPSRRNAYRLTRRSLSTGRPPHARRHRKHRLVPRVRWSMRTMCRRARRPTARRITRNRSAQRGH